MDAPKYLHHKYPYITRNSRPPAQGGSFKRIPKQRTQSQTPIHSSAQPVIKVDGSHLPSGALSTICGSYAGIFHDAAASFTGSLGAAHRRRFAGPACSPRLIVHLYRMRWQIEKSFDEFKNKLHETKAWASSNNAKQIQAHLIYLTENLLLLLRHSLEIHETFATRPKSNANSSAPSKRLPRSPKLVAWFHFHCSCCNT
jgi:transposase